MTYKVTLKNLTKKFGSRVILRDLNLKFDKDHIYLITGKNGCGKSTLLNILSKYDTDYEGDYDSNGLRIAYLLQDDLLFRNLTVEDNLKLQIMAEGKEPDPTRIKTLAGKLGLLDLLDRNVSQLSGGEKKKVAIGQLILKEADLVLLDEPNANIQKEYAQDLIDFIYEEFKGKILVIASHDKLKEPRDREMVKIKLEDGVAYYGI